MKLFNLNFLLFSLVIGLLFSCKSRAVHYAAPEVLANVKLGESPAKGFIYINTNGTAEKYTSTSGNVNSDAAAKQNAVRRALELLLFQGVPGTEFERPLISQAAQDRALANNKEYFDRLLGSEYSNNFLKEKVLNVRPFNVKYVVAEGHVLVNYDALRKDLEAKKVIQRFAL